MEQQELRNIIEKGVEKLEEIADVKWQASNFKLSKNNFITSIQKSIEENIPMYKALGYKTKSVLASSTGKVFTNIKNRPKGIYWQHFILKLSGYKRCTKCEEVKKLSDFYNKKGDKKEAKCISCLHCNKKETVLHIINIMIREGKFPECAICGYKENWAALEFHHINPELERPEWTYNKDGNKRYPGDYIMSVNKVLAEKRYLAEMNNLELLCRNCHVEEHSKNKNRQIGLEKALIHLGSLYKCEICKVDKNLELHHNLDDKNISFHAFANMSKDRILKDGLLETEMKKDVIILCGNHHREIHNPKWTLPIKIGEL